jgi:hypothetical protein
MVSTPTLAQSQIFMRSLRIATPETCSSCSMLSVITLDQLTREFAPQGYSFTLSFTKLCRDFAQISPFNNQSDYHDKCQITDFDNATNVEHCRLANLPVSSSFLSPIPISSSSRTPTQDLNQDDPYVRSTLLRWAASLRDIGFDGLRVDTVPEVKPSFWAEFTQAAAMYTVGTRLIGTLARQESNSRQERL